MQHHFVRRFARAALSLAVVATALPAQAQQVTTGAIHGTVVDSATGAPVVGALVTLDAGRRAEITHGDGTFNFTRLAAGPHALAVERLGYAPLRVEVEVVAGQTVHPRVGLRVSALSLGGLVVTGTIGARAGQDLLSPTSVLSGAELDRRLDLSVAATLQSEPGVSISGVGPTTARPIIRGLGGDRILILEDGARAGDMSSTSADHAVAVEALTAQRFEVVRGPMSLMYGSSALGGVVNVVRDEVPAVLPADPHGVFALQGTSVNSGVTGGGYVTTGIGRIALRAEGSYRTSGDVSTPAGDLTNTGVENVNLSAGASWIGADAHGGLAYRFYDNEYGIPGGFVGGHEEGVTVAMRRHTLKAQSEFHGVSWFDGVQLRSSFTDYHHQEIEEGGEVGTEFLQDLGAVEAVGRHEGVGPFTEGALGVRAQYRDIQTGGSLRTPSTRDYTLAGYVVEEVPVGRGRAQVGLRYDWARYEPRDTTAFVSVGGERIPVRARTFGSVSGSAGLLWPVGEAVRVGASVARAYRTPDFNELYSNGPHLAANSFDVGDPQLEHETGLGVDAFVRYGSPTVQAEVAAFRNQLDNYVFPSSRGRAELGAQGGRPRFQYTNEDALFVGMEGEVEWSVTEAFVASATASYVRAEFTSERAPIPVIEATDTTFVPASPHPPLIPPLNGRLALRYDRPEWFAQVETRLTAEQERTGDFEAPTEGHVVHGLSAGVRLQSGERTHAVTVRVDNASDVEYRNHTSRIKDIMPEPGRNVSLLYRLSF